MVLMLCESCGQERSEKDFFVGEQKCYKCILRDKISQGMGKYCKICGAKVERGRWVYCSKQCMDVGDKDRKANYWTKKIKCHPN